MYSSVYTCINMVSCSLLVYFLGVANFSPLEAFSGHAFLWKYPVIVQEISLLL